MPLASASSDSQISHSPLAIQRAGLIEYSVALETQRMIHREVAEGVRPNTLLILEHPSVFTAGKKN